MNKGNYEGYDSQPPYIWHKGSVIIVVPSIIYFMF